MLLLKWLLAMSVLFAGDLRHPVQIMDMEKHRVVRELPASPEIEAAAVRLLNDLHPYVRVRVPEQGLLIKIPLREARVFRAPNGERLRASSIMLMKEKGTGALALIAFNDRQTPRLFAVPAERAARLLKLLGIGERRMQLT